MRPARYAGAPHFTPLRWGYCFAYGTTLEYPTQPIGPGLGPAELVVLKRSSKHYVTRDRDMRRVTAISGTHTVGPGSVTSAITASNT